LLLSKPGPDKALHLAAQCKFNSRGVTYPKIAISRVR
jgi:hypothetical protein